MRLFRLGLERRVEVRRDEAAVAWARTVAARQLAAIWLDFKGKSGWSDVAPERWLDSGTLDPPVYCLALFATRPARPHDRSTLPSVDLLFSSLCSTLPPTP